MFWSRVSRFILQNRVLLVALTLLATAFMGWQGSQVQLSYELARFLPNSDPDYALYQQFKARYGEDGNVMAIGVETDAMYRLGFFNDWYKLNRRIRQIDGVKDVVSNANLFTVVRDDSLQRFRFKPLTPQSPTTQATLDSLRQSIRQLPIYREFVQDSAERTHLMAITFDPSRVNTKGRIGMVREIEAIARQFGETHKLTMHLSGMPYIRTEFTAKVSSELVLTIGLALAVTGLILALFFRSIPIVLAALFVVCIGVVISLGYTVLFDYRITVLTGLIPPLIIVIGIPNAIFLLNRYQEELSRGHSKIAALTIAVEKVGETTFFANITTSIGFFVFYFTNSPILVEFGIVAALSIMTTYATSLVLIPAIFSYLPTPSEQQRGHLQSGWLTAFLNWVNQLVHHRRGLIYGVVAATVCVGTIGLLRIVAVGYVVDDLPKDDPIYADLKFFEQHFKGVMPFEVAIDAGRPGRALTPQTLIKIRRLEREFANYPEFTRPISIVEAIKFFYQAYRGGDPRFFVLPPALELQKLATYSPQLTGTENAGAASGFKAYLDSSKRYTRISFQTADVGNVRLKQLVAELKPRADSIFNLDAETGQRVALGDQYKVSLTGNSLIFARGNDYLVQNLIESTLLAILLVSIIMVILLRDLRLSLIAILPSIVPLLITAGIMGYAGIHLKPSTILIFSIAFGISSDGTIYFITKYRDELRNHPSMSLGQAVTITIQQTGISMFYTAMILFAGFAIFTASGFQGTKSLGLLVSITLLMGMASNLILLPAFLLSIDRKRQQRALSINDN